MYDVLNLVFVKMTVTWTSGYNIDEATPFVEWGWKGHDPKLSPAGTLTFTRGSMCGINYNLMSNLIKNYLMHYVYKCPNHNFQIVET